MLRVLLPLRFIMLVASLGAAVGALLMFWLGASKTFDAVRAALGRETANSAIGSVMGATDSFLFGVVLVIFAYAITFGFVVELPAEDRARLPAWMRVEGVAGLKRILVEVILVYLVVDFATDVAEAERHLDWHTLVMPASILLIAAALRLLSHAPPHPAPTDAPEHGSG
ncbi:MAG TPA: YqhA family protein [Beijerinckiaceae bacterium]|jgi:uncharacterized membrane protein YqhA